MIWVQRASQRRLSTSFSNSKGRPNQILAHCLKWWPTEANHRRKPEGVASSNPAGAEPIYPPLGESERFRYPGNLIFSKWITSKSQSAILEPIQTSVSIDLLLGSRIRQRLGQISPAVKFGCTNESMAKSSGTVASSSIIDEQLKFDIVRKTMNPNRRPFS